MRRAPLWWAVPVLGHLFGLTLFAAAPAARFGFPLDDAWIHRVYARSVAAGRGFAYNPSRAEAGATSPLWVIVSAPAHWLAPLGTEAVVMAVKSLGAVLTTAALASTGSLAAALTGRWEAGWLAALVFALEPRLLFAALSGMETPLLLALWLGGLSAALRGRPRRALLFASLLPLARPEGALLLAAWPLVLPPDFKGGRSAGRLQRWAWAWIPAALWVAVCLRTTGHPLPNTFYLKARKPHLGLAELRTAFEILTGAGFGVAPAAWLALAALGLGCRRGLGRGRRRVVATGLLGFPCLYVLAVAATRRLVPAGYYWTRWLDAPALVLAAGSVVGFVLAVVRPEQLLPAAGLDPPGTSRSRQRPAGLVRAGAVLAALASVPPVAASFRERRARLASDARAVQLVDVRAGRWVAAHLPPGAALATNDAGAVRYFGNRWTLDLMGLNHADLAFGRRSRRELMASHSIRWLLVFPSWFAGSPLLAGFVPRRAFGVPAAEYTVCPCPGQNELVLFEARRDRALDQAPPSTEPGVGMTPSSAPRPPTPTPPRAGGRPRESSAGPPRPP